MQRAEQLAVERRRDDIRRQLVERGYYHLHHLEQEAEGERRLHLFLANDESLPFLNKITNGESRRGGAIGFDPEQFVCEQLSECRWVEKYL